MRNSHLSKSGLGLTAADIKFEFPEPAKVLPPQAGRQPTTMKPRTTDKVQERISPLKPSTAKILPPYGSKCSQASALIEPREGRVLWSARGIEKKAMVTLLAAPAAKTIQEQAARITYCAADDQIQQHVLDHIAHRWDQQKPAYVIKPGDAAVKHHLRDLARRV
ncbi:hypothetical protein [Devosia sp. 1635]|uniref:hypothetical protein n=1 Tax=Devosia sp. 1635 TaxID=2726066 RepID=UPI001566236C|nr:hypothetical protein [Devosia sp. 1635]